MNRTPDDVLSELLVLRSQEGDTSAWRQLIELWQHRLYIHARRLTRQDEAARDAVQDAWMSMVRGLHRLDDPSRFRGWAYRIVTNKANDWLRSQQRQRNVVDGNDDVTSVQDSSEPSELAEHADDIQLLLRMIYRLPPDQRALLTMAYQEQTPLAEIARVLDVPVGTVKSRLYKIRQDLKTLIEESEP